MKKSILIFFVFGLVGCASVKYYPPIEITQEKIAEMKTLDQSGRQSNPRSGLINNCTFRKMGLTQNCSQIICKDDSSKPTGLTCLIYHPIEVPLSPKEKP